MFFFFWVGGIGDGKRRLRDPWSSSCVSSLSCRVFKQSITYVFMFCIICLGLVRRVGWIPRILPHIRLRAHSPYY